MAYAPYTLPFATESNTSVDPTTGSVSIVTFPSGYRLGSGYVSKQDHVSRARPSPADLLFSGVGFTHEKVDRRDTLLTAWGTSGANIRRSILNYGGAGSGLPSEPEDDLTSRLHEKVKNEKVNLALALAEYRQTASLFADSAIRVADAWRSFKRGRPIRGFSRVGGRSKRKLSSNWLQYQYGVMPLYFDVKGSLEALDNRMLSKPILRKVVVRSMRSYYSHTKENYYVAGSYETASRSNSGYRSSRATLYHTYDSDLLQTASSLGLTNPLSLAWELVPYSFVIDWFINVGDYLSALDTQVGIGRLKWYKGTREVEYNEFTLLDGVSRYTRKTTTRSGPLDLSLPTLTVSPSLSWKRVVSGLALLRQSRSLFP